MRYKTISIGLKRDCRLARFNVSQCSVQFTAEVEPEDDLASAYKELYEDVVFVVEEMVEVEKQNYKEEMAKK